MTDFHPNREELQQLVAGELDDAEQSRLMAHLDECPACCVLISELADDDLSGDKLAGDIALVGAVAHHVLPTEAALLRVIEKIKEQSPTGSFGCGSGSDGDVTAALDFLAPDDDPSHLGRLGRYAVLEEIGRGASGIVLKALDEQLGRMVALKVLSPRLATNELARRRFVREAKAAAAIRDDHVIGIHHVEEVDGLPFLVMEYIVGRSLAQRIDADGPLPVADILRIGSQIARGLAAAHAQGLVHRDIKPANILLENGVERVKITDFGLAHAVDDVRTTQPGVVIGTPEYMSPEQARGERVGTKSDLFSLGCVLYAMCAGRPPFRAESTLAILRRVCEDTPRPLSEINLEIPAWLSEIIAKLMAKDAAERFQSASEVAELLEKCLVYERGARNSERGATPHDLVRPVLSKPRSALRAPSSALKGWSLAAAILILLAAALGMAESTGVTHVAATVIRIVRGDGTLVVEIDDPSIQVLIDGEELVITGAGPKEFRLRPGEHELQSIQDGQPMETKLVTIARDGREVVKVTRESGRASESKSPSALLDTRSGEKPSQTVVSRVPPPAAPFADGPVREFVGHSQAVTDIDLSPDGMQLISAGGSDRTVRLWDVETGQQIRKYDLHLQVHRVAFLPGGERAAVLFNGEMVECDLASDKVSQPKQPVFKQFPYLLAVMMERRYGLTRFAAGSALGEVVIWDHASGHEWTRFSAGVSVGAMGFLPDGRLATVANEGKEAKLRVWSQHQPPGTRFSATCPRRSMALAVSPDGKLIAVTQYNVEKADPLLPGSPDPAVIIFDAETGEKTQELFAPTWSLNCATFTPDGKSILAGGWDFTVYRWDVASGKLTGQQKVHNGFVNDIIVTPDGQHFFTAGGGVPGDGHFAPGDDHAIRLWRLRGATP